MNNNLTSKEKLNIFKDLFRGRNDVFAIRWQSADGLRSGYMPVCQNEWKRGLCLKLNREKCRNCTNKKYSPISDLNFIEHLTGQKFYGIYPLLQDNKSYFIAVDFDKEDWLDDTRKFVEVCNKYKLPIYTERSRSGNGSHVWIFFEDEYPAAKSRKIILKLLKEIELINELTDIDSNSFDLIIPRQDLIDENEIGNLIALPLNGVLKLEDKTVFWDIDKDEPIQDQWQYLQSVKKIKPAQLDKILAELGKDSGLPISNLGKTIQITLSNKLYLSDNLPVNLTKFLKANLRFVNLEFLIKRKMGVGFYNIEKAFNLIEQQNNQVVIPRGFWTKLKTFLKENKIKFKLTDKRVKLKPVRFDSNLTLRGYQTKALTEMVKCEDGILVAPPGSGKTIMGLEMITKLGQPALIIVHKKQIFNQWFERAETFLSIPKKEIGQICAGKNKIGEKVTVAMIQSMNRLDVKKELDGKFGSILVDECHHMPAKMFRNVISNLSPYYIFGLTATPERKYKDEKLIFAHLGDVIYTIRKNDLQEDGQNKSTGKINLLVVNTHLSLPFSANTDNNDMWSKFLIFNEDRNLQIEKDIIFETSSNRKCLVLTERKEQAEALNFYLSSKLETIVLTGDLTDKKRKEKLAQVKTGNFQVIIATGQLLGEGTDINSLDCLFLVYPFSFHGKLIQYIGRITRNFGESCGNVYDYRDKEVPYLDKLFKRRAQYYDKYLNS